MVGRGLYATFYNNENNQFLIRVYMSIFSDKKEKTSIITPAKSYSLSYRLRSIDWNEDFYFDNPIDKEKIDSVSKAMKIAKDIFLAVERAAMQFRDNHRWDDYIFFTMAAENILGATIYYYCKHFPKEYCNLAYIIGTVCHIDITILLEMLKRDKETEIFIRCLDDSHKLRVDGEYIGIKNALEVFLGRFYTKEFFYVFVNEEYDTTLSSADLLVNFDSVLKEVSSLEDNDFVLPVKNMRFRSFKE
jgi:hypothetical protein